MPKPKEKLDPKELKATIALLKRVTALYELTLVLRDLFADQARIYLSSSDARVECQKFVKSAVQLKLDVAGLRIQAVRMYRDAPKDWVRRMGYYRTRNGGEANYYCLFCEESVATFGYAQGVKRLAKPFTDKLELHIAECAMRWVSDPAYATHISDHFEVDSTISKTTRNGQEWPKGKS